MTDEPSVDNIAKLAQEKAKKGDGLSEDSLALLFVTRHADQLRYVAAWGRWLEWDGARWKPDHTLRVFDLARDSCREALGKSARRKLNAKTVAAVEKLAKADRRTAATVGQWDVDPWFFVTQGGDDVGD